MTKELTPRQSVIMALYQKFPTASTRALGRMAYNQSPECFSNEAAARLAVAKMRGGSNGKTQQIQRMAKSESKGFSTLPEGKTQFEDWASVKIDGPSRALILADAHIPYHSKAELLLAIKYGKDAKADTIILNGDTADFFSVSFWEKDPRQRNFAEELKTVRQFLQMLRREFQKSRIIYKLGNHEERYERFMRVKAPELLGVDSFQLAAMFELSNLGIELVEDKRPIRLGSLNVIHGHEYRFAISNPVNPARGLFLRCKAHAVCGHFHQSSHHTDKTVEDSVIATWSTGCLCDLHPEYAPLNNWCHGFAFVEVGKDGKFHLHNKVIRNQRIY